MWRRRRRQSETCHDDCDERRDDASKRCDDAIHRNEYRMLTRAIQHNLTTTYQRIIGSRLTLIERIVRLTARSPPFELDDDAIRHCVQEAARYDTSSGALQSPPPHHHHDDDDECRVCIALASVQAHLDDVCGDIVRSLSSVNAILDAMAHTAPYGVLLCADMKEARSSGDIGGGGDEAVKK